jgi:uncharacterized protein (TIGR04540 family)
MEIKLFYKSQVEIADVINQLIDRYWENNMDESLLIHNINKLYDNNLTKILKDREFTTVIRQKCGKRRIEVVARILKLSDKFDMSLP